MSRRVFLKFNKGGPASAKARAAFMAGVNARRTAKVMAVRAALARPTGLGATRGFRPVGRRTVGERKVIDVGVTTAQVNTTGAITLLNGSTQGTDYTNRIGRKIVVKSLYIRGAMLNEQANNQLTTGTQGAQAGRMIVFVDMQPNGATPAVTDLLVSASPYSQLNLNNRDRFKIIKDKMYFFDPYVYTTTATQASAALTNQIKQIKCYKNMNLETIYNSGNAGTIGDIQSGALYLLFIGSATSGTTDLNANLSIRVRFVDP